MATLEVAISRKQHEKPAKRSSFIGFVRAMNSDKTISVLVDRNVRHLKYGKICRRQTVIKVHDERNAARVGDRVLVASCRRLSRTKHHRLVRIITPDDKSEFTPVPANPSTPALKPEEAKQRLLSKTQLQYRTEVSSRPTSLPIALSKPPWSVFWYDHSATTWLLSEAATVQSRPDPEWAEFRSVHNLRASVHHGDVLVPAVVFFESWRTHVSKPRSVAVRWAVKSTLEASELWEQGGFLLESVVKSVGLKALPTRWRILTEEEGLLTDHGDPLILQKITPSPHAGFARKVGAFEFVLDRYEAETQLSFAWPANTDNSWLPVLAELVSKTTAFSKGPPKSARSFSVTEAAVGRMVTRAGTELVFT